MTIQALDWLMYFVILIIMWWMFPRDWKEELGTLMGLLVSFVYTIIYCIVFWYYSWAEIFGSINTSIDITW